MEGQKETSKSNLLMVLFSFLGLYFLSTGLSLVFSFYILKDKGSKSVFTLSNLEEARKKISEDLPKNEVCPINGEKFTTIEKSIWEKRRPIGVIIENHSDSRPQSGLSKADVVYEAVAEGGITRFLAIFYCRAASEEVKVAPVRSARVYFIDWLSEYADYPLFMHVGGANRYGGSKDTAPEVDALGLLEKLGWRIPKGNDFDTTYDSGYPVFWRNYERLGKKVATEHTMMASLDKAYEEAKKRGFEFEFKGIPWNKDFVQWKFADDSRLPIPKSKRIEFDFWTGMPDYNVVWEYDRNENVYLRSNGGKEHKDLETDKTLIAKNVVLMFVTQKGPVDANKHMFYQTTGSGKALVFQNGDVIEGTWKKPSRKDRLLFYDKGGKEIQFVRGPIWIEALPLGNSVKY